MRLLKRIFDEALGLFVDDGAYAASIIVWLIGMAVLVRFTVFGPVVAGPLLFVGLAAILVQGALRKARK